MSCHKRLPRPGDLESLFWSAEEVIVLRKRGLLVGLVVLAVILLVWSQLEDRDGHERMLAALEDVERRTEDKNYYFGEAVLAQIDDALTMELTHLQRVSLNYQRGGALLRLGRTLEAIETYEYVRDELPSLREHSDTHNLDEIQKQVNRALAVAHLRRGETDNCVHCQTGESCILPIAGDGVHTRPSGSRAAITYFERLLEQRPDSVADRWLLNLAHMTLGSHPSGVPEEYLIPPERFKPEREFPRFPNIAAALDLDVFGLAGGAIVDDFDRDGFLDIVVSDWNPSVSLRYFRNVGDGSFEDRSEQAGFTGLLGGLNLKQADYDNDGDLDILVLRGGWMGPMSSHPNSLLQNDGQARFRDVTFEVGLGEVHLPTQTAEWADYDNDGDLDLYIGNEEMPSQLFRNNGEGTFEDVASSAGVTNERYAKGVAWGDYDDDGFPDLYVSNLGYPNRLYHNNRDGTFSDVATELGVAAPLDSFPVWSWDFNNDGKLDFYVSAYDVQDGIDHFAADFLNEPHNSQVDHLYQGDGSSFRDVAAQQRVGRVTLPMGSNFGDLNADGFLDYYLGTGYTEYIALMPNLMFLNNGQAGGFSDVTMAGGFGHIQKGHGVSFADIDNDGDQDIFTVMGGAFPGDGFTNALFANPGFGNHWITIDLVGTESNRFGIGARIRLVFQEDGKERSVFRWVGSGGSFGANPIRQEIGVGQAERLDLLEVYWPTSRQTQQFQDVEVDRYIEITEGQADFRERPWKTLSLPTSITVAEVRRDER